MKRHCPLNSGTFKLERSGIFDFWEEYIESASLSASIISDMVIMEEMSDSLRINISVPFLEELNNLEKGIIFIRSNIIMTINNINIYFKFLF